MRSYVFKLVVAGLVLGLFACSDDADKKTAASPDSGPAVEGDEMPDAGNPDAGGTLDAGAVTGDAMVPVDGGSKDAGPMGPPANLMVKSNLTGVTFAQDADENEGVRVTSFSLFQKAPNSAGYYTVFYVSLKNFGSKKVCQTSVTFDVKGMGGTNLYPSDTAYPDAELSDDTIIKGTVVPCIAPGQEAVAWSNDLSPTGVSVSAIRNVSFEVFAQPREAPAVVMPPTMQGVTVFDPFGAGNAGFMGTLKIGAQNVEDPGVLFYVRDAAGYYRDLARDTKLGSFAAGASIAINATGCERTTPALATETVSTIKYRLPLMTKAAAPYGSFVQAQQRAEAAREARARQAQ